MERSIRIVSAVLSAILVISFTSCGRKNSESESTSEMSATLVTEDITDTTAASEYGESTELISKTDEYISAYKDYLKNYISENGKSAFEPSFSLHYLDDDDIPELFISTSGSHLGRVIILKYYNNQVSELGTLGRNGVIGFGERQGIVVEINTAKMQSTAKVYQIKNGSFKEKWTGTHLFGGYPSSDTKETYLVNGKKVNKVKFEKELNDNLPGTILTNVKSYDADVFPTIKFAVDGESHKLTIENIEAYIR